MPYTPRLLPLLCQMFPNISGPSFYYHMIGPQSIFRLGSRRLANHAFVVVLYPYYFTNLPVNLFVALI